MALHIGLPNVPLITYIYLFVSLSLIFLEMLCIFGWVLCLGFIWQLVVYYFTFIFVFALLGFAIWDFEHFGWAFGLFLVFGYFLGMFVSGWFVLLFCILLFFWWTAGILVEFSVSFGYWRSFGCFCQRIISVASLFDFSVVAYVVSGILVGLLMFVGCWLFLVVFVSGLLMFGFYLSVFVVCFEMLLCAFWLGSWFLLVVG